LASENEVNIDIHSLVFLLAMAAVMSSKGSHSPIDSLEQFIARYARFPYRHQDFGDGVCSIVERDEMPSDRADRAMNWSTASGLYSL
jgi:hypothetical protein